MRISTARLLAFSSVALASMSLPAIAKADTITVGNPLIGGISDNCEDCGFIIGQAFSQAGYTVTSYNYESIGDHVGGDITPLLFTQVSGGFVLAAIGTEVVFNGVAPGDTPAYIGSYGFGLTSGSDVTTSATFFGFENFNGSQVAYNNTTPDLINGGAAAYQDASTLQVGDFIPVSGTTQDAYNEDLTRVYSINATAV